MRISPIARLTAPLAAAVMLAAPGAHAEENAAPNLAESLTSEFVYKYLVGEVAGQRGNIALASGLFYDLAASTRDPRLAERAARAAAYGNQPQLAIRAATLWAQLDPDSTEAQQAVAQMLLSTGNLSEAGPYLAKLLAPADTRGNGFLYLNGILARHPDRAAALQLAQELAKPYPDLAEAQFVVAHLAWNAGQEALALEALKRAEQLRPGWEVAALLHAEMLLRQSPAEALAFYRDFLARHPEANETRLAYAKLLVNQKQLEEARTQFTQLAAVAGNNPDMAVVVGLLAGQMGDYAQADNYFKQALERGFKQPDQIFIYLGQSAEKQDRPDEAIKWYQQVAEGEQHLEAQFLIASVLAGQGKLAEARALLHDIPELSSEEQAAALQVEANLLTQAKQHADAYAVLDRAVNTLPNTPELVYDYAMAAERVQRYDIMEQQLRKLIKLKPDFAQAYNALGYTLADRNERLPEAAELIEKALMLKPDDHYILDSMGWVHYRLGKLDLALDYLRRAYAERTDPEIAAHLGEVLWQQGKREEATRTWDEALRAHPDNEVLLNTSKKFRP